MRHVLAFLLALATLGVSGIVAAQSPQPEKRIALVIGEALEDLELK